VPMFAPVFKRFVCINSWNHSIIKQFTKAQDFDLLHVYTSEEQEKAAT